MVRFMFDMPWRVLAPRLDAAHDEGTVDAADRGRACGWAGRGRCRTTSGRSRHRRRWPARSNAWCRRRWRPQSRQRAPPPLLGLDGLPYVHTEHARSAPRDGLPYPQGAPTVSARRDQNLIRRYALEPMAGLFSDEARYQTWLEVEILAVEAGPSWRRRSPAADADRRARTSAGSQAGGDRSASSEIDRRRRGTPSSRVARRPRAARRGACALAASG